MFVKLSFRELRDSSYLLYIILILWPQFIKFKLVTNRKADCEFMRHQSSKIVTNALSSEFSP